MKKLGKRLISHRYDRRTLARFRTWGIGQELVVWDLPDAKIGIKNTFPNFYVINKLFISHPASGNPINKLVISWLFRTRARLQDTKRFSRMKPVCVKSVLSACFTAQNFYFPTQYVLWVYNALIINMCLCVKMPSGDKRGTKNRIPKERKTIKPFQKNHTEMLGTLFVPYPLVLLVPRIES